MSDQPKPGEQTKMNVPEGWKVGKIRDVVALIESGTSVNGDDRPLLTDEKGVLKVSAVSGGKFSPEAVKAIWLTEYDRAKTPVRRNSILFARASGSADLVGASVFLQESCDNLFLPDKIWQIQSTSPGSTKWLFYLINTQKVKDELLQASSGGSGMKNVSQSNFLEVNILLPPLPEQQKIASILSDWDDSLSILSKLIEAKRQQKRGLAEQLLTGKRRLPGFTGGWEETSLEALVGQKKILLGRGSVISKKDIEATPGDYPIYSSSVKNDGLFGHYGEYMFDEEMITWSIDGGGNFFYRKPHRFSVTNVSGFLKADKKFLDYYWLFSILNYLHAFEQFDYQKKAHPSVILGLYKFNLPSLPEQKAIASVLSTLDSELSSLSSLRSSLLVQKRGLMDLLLTGKVRVNTNDKTQ